MYSPIPFAEGGAVRPLTPAQRDLRNVVAHMLRAAFEGMMDAVEAGVSNAKDRARAYRMTIGSRRDAGGAEGEIGLLTSGWRKADGWTAAGEIASWDFGSVADILQTDAATAPLASYYAAGADKTSAALGLSWGRVNEYARDYAKARAAEMVGMRRATDGSLVPNPSARWRIDTDTRTKLRDLVVEMFESGTSYRDLRSAIEALPAFSGIFGETRAEMIARTECLPANALINRAVVKAISRRWYDGPFVHIRTVGGREFSATPNHPVLSPAGWVRLDDLTPGDYLVCDRGKQHASSAGHPYIETRPAPIGEVRDALSAIATEERRRGAKPDFHGDGRDGEVDILTARRTLMIGEQPAFSKHGLYFGFESPYFAHAPRGLRLRESVVVAEAARFCHSASVDRLAIERTGDGADVHSHGAGEAGQRFAAAVARDDLFGITYFDEVVRTTPAREKLLARGAQASCGPGSPNPVVDGTRVDADLSRYLAAAAPAEIEIDRVLSISIRPFSGHVFNLQSADGYYTANAVYTSNTAIAANQGSGERFKAAGVTHVLVLDNETCPTCGPWADTVQTVEWALANPVQHPHCIRAFSPAAVTA